MASKGGTSSPAKVGRNSESGAERGGEKVSSMSGESVVAAW